jgi:aspartyl-tRNA(Asn)/glutamyl-tRNA(Gln) amidotransferase subunit A
MSIEQKARAYLEKIKKENPKINAVLYLNPNLIEEAKALDKKTKKGRLHGYIIGIKANINVKGFPVSCASKSLEKYIAPYDATVIQKLKSEDALILGMLNMDEFACGASGETSAFGPTQNPSAPGKIPGGSSSGSAAAVAAGFCDAALGSDTGGSIRNPASHCGIIGLKPSYGLVSRHGLCDLSMSLDQISPATKTVDDAALILDVIKGKDEKDTTSIASNPIKLQKTSKLKVGIIKIPGTDKKIQSLIDTQIDKFCKHTNSTKKEIKIKHIELAVQTYYPLVYAEFFSSTRRIDGRRYGKKIEENCGAEVLRRILGGSEITKAEFENAYYKKALQVKELIKSQFEEAFKQVDCIMLPTVPSLPWNVGDIKNMSVKEVYAYDALTTPANLAGICAISIPAGTIPEAGGEQVRSTNHSNQQRTNLREGSKLNIPTGLQIMCSTNEESLLLSIAKQAESILK